MILIDQSNYESVWTNAVKTLTPNKLNFTNGINEPYAISFEVLFNFEKCKIISLSCSFHKNIAISLVDSENSETVRVNINPFYVNDRYLIPMEIFSLEETKNYKFIRMHLTGDFAFEKIELLDCVEDITYEFKVMLFSGIGDCLKTIARNTSLIEFSKRFSIIVYWSYGGRGLHDSGWKDLLEKNVFRDVVFKYIDNDKFESLEVSELFNGYSGQFLLSGYFANEKRGISVPLNDGELRKVKEVLKNSYVRVGIQLQGNDPKKTFGYDKTILLFKLLLAHYPLATIFIIDAPSRVVPPELLFNERVVNLVGETNLSENITLIQSMDLWIAPDSFSKYVASWGDVRQIILCTELPYVTPVEMLKHAFDNSGLIGNPRVKLVGIKYDPVSLEVSSIVHDVSEISVDDVAEFL